MDKHPPGFKNEVIRVRPAVPEVIRNYPEKRFWKVTDAPFLSKSYLKFYLWGGLFWFSSYAAGIWVVWKFNLFNQKIWRGNYTQQVETATEFPDLDDSLLYPAKDTFTQKFREREKQRLEQIQRAKLKRREAGETKTTNAAPVIPNVAQAKIG